MKWFYDKDCMSWLAHGSKDVWDCSYKTLRIYQAMQDLDNTNFRNSGGNTRKHSSS